VRACGEDFSRPSALAYAISRAKHFDRETPRPVGVTSVSLKIEARCIGIIQFNAMLHFWQIPQSLLVQTRLNLWDQSVPDGKITFWSTESQARFESRGDQDDGNMHDASLPLCDADVFRFRVLIA